MTSVRKFAQRKADWFFVTFFAFNWLVAVCSYDTAMVFVPQSCSVGVPTYCNDTASNIYDDYIFYPPFAVSIIRGLYQHMHDCNPLATAKPTWFITTLWIGLIFWFPFYPWAIYAFIKGDPKIRIPCIMYCSVMLTMFAEITAENFVGPYQRSEMTTFFQENMLWLITIPVLLFRMLRSEHPFADNKIKSI